MAGVSHCLSSRDQGSIPSHGWSISKVFFLADHTLPTRSEPVWQKMVQSPLNGTSQIVDVEEEGWKKRKYMLVSRMVMACSIEWIPLWVGLGTSMGGPRHLYGWASIPLWVGLDTSMGGPRYLYGWASIPLWVGLDTSMGGPRCLYGWASMGGPHFIYDPNPKEMREKAQNGV